MVETVQGLALQLGTQLHPAHVEFIARYAGVNQLSTDPKPLFDGSMPRIVAWVYEQFAA
jgi:hypothetical protein